MATVSLDHRFKIAPDALWEELWNPGLIGWMCEHLTTIEKREVLSQETLPDGRTKRIVRTTPRDRIPAVARSVLTVEMLAWEEEQLFWRTFRSAEPRIDFTIMTTSERLRSFFKCQGVYTLEPEGTGTVRRIKANLDVRAGPLVRRLAESYLLDEVKKGLEEEARQLTAFLDRPGR